MTFLKNKTAYKKWAKEIDGGQPQAPIDPPAKFPCFGYTVVHSFGYEEESARYLYAEDVAEMFNQFAHTP